MSLIVENFPVEINKSKIDYEEFIYILSKKANLNKFSKAEIKSKWVEYFSKDKEKKLMELDSVKWLYNLI